MPKARCVALLVARLPVGPRLPLGLRVGPAFIPLALVRRRITSLPATRRTNRGEWHGAPGPYKRGNMCVTHTDPLRGYGYQAPCKK
jgi:hypothetical protein